MLILNTERDALLKPLQTVTGIVEKKQSMPILSNVLIKAEGGRISITATDSEIQINTVGPQCNADFAVTTNAKKLESILKALPEGQNVLLDLEDERLTLKSGRSKFNLQTLPAHSFPLISADGEVTVAFSLSQGKLREMLSQIQFSMASQDVRFFLNGMFWHIENNMLRLVATDGHRLGYYEHIIEANLPEHSAIVPRKTILELMKLLQHGDNPITIQILRDRQVRFVTEDAVIISNVIDGTYPAYQRVIPQDNANIFTIGRTELLDMLDRIGLLASEKTRIVRMSISPGLLTATCSNSDREEANEELEIAYAGPILEMSFKLSYLTDMLRSNHSDDLTLAFGENAQIPTLITVPENPDYKYVVMPLRY